ncbi:hypothetical protein BGZ75_007733 [Mortierella antarctica]|nr:hypothetical protein BGZ75_007733 [Mortierella antarctica]
MSRIQLTDQRLWREQPLGAISRTTYMLLIAIALGFLISISNLVTMVILLIQQRNGEYAKGGTEMNQTLATVCFSVLVIHSSKAKIYVGS